MKNIKFIALALLMATTICYGQEQPESTITYKTPIESYVEYAEFQYKLGEMYANGKGVNKDYKRAVVWYTKSAKQGNAPAQESLGKMYRDGQGVTRDYKEAYMWFSLAVMSGDGNRISIMHRANVARVLSQADLADAEKEAKDLHEKINQDK